MHLSDHPINFDEGIHNPDIDEDWIIDADDIVNAIELDEGEEPNDDSDMDDESEEEVIDNSVLTFRKHTEAVLSCAFHIDNKVVATGGTDEKVYLWDVETGNLLQQFEHSESVDVVAFSPDGRYLASGDIDGVIKVWEGASQVAMFELHEDITWLRWHTEANVLLASCTNGNIYMYKVTGESKLVAPSFTASCGCSALLPDGKRLVAGYADGSLRLHDLKFAETLLKMDAAYPSEVLSVDVHHDKPVVIAGYGNGGVVLFNLQTGKVATILAHGSNEGFDIEAVRFFPHGSLSLCASGGREVSVFDLASTSVRFRHHIDASVTVMAWHPTLPQLYAGYNDGCVRVFCVLTNKQIAEYSGHKSVCLSLQISRCGSKLVTTSEDYTAKVYNLPIA